MLIVLITALVCGVGGGGAGCELVRVEDRVTETACPVLGYTLDY